MSSTTVIEAPTSHKLELHTAYGPVYRDVLNTEPRDATEEEVPIIDLAGLSSGLESRKEIAKALRVAGTNMGFFYIKNHGIDEEVIAKAKSQLLTFFKQNTEAKEQVSQDKSKYYNGWKAPRSTNISRTESVDVKESFSWRYQPENDPDHPQPLSSLPAEVQPWIRGEEFVWQGTSHLPDFKSDVLNYWKSCLQLARQLVKVFALSLDLPEDYFDTRTTFPGADGVMNYYPITTAEETASNAVGLGSHTDLQLFTLLWQDEVGGLQVLTKEGQWIKATPKPGTFVVNIGDFMMRLSNDFFKSTVHRVYNRAKVERVSMPFFFGLNFNCVEGVIPTCTSEDDPPKYEPISCGDWCQLRFKLEAERMAKKLAEQDATTKLLAK
ncbi:Clavaminate synthase-like protein [Aureobasidium pullulans]|nr:Clavaminate synthase-like protein [Aureobasidium pullulans]